MKGNSGWIWNSGLTKDKGSEIALIVARDIGHPALSEMRRTLGDWGLFRGFGNDALDNIRGAQLLSGVTPLRVEPDGSNLVSVVYQMTNDPRFRHMNEAFHMALRSAFPEMERVSILLSSAGKGELHYVSADAPDRPIPALSMSDGQLRFIGLAAILLMPDPPPLIAIDEPEIGLHPALLPLLAELLKQASQRIQVIVATHSAQLLDAEAIEPLRDVILVEREAGATTFEHPDQEKLQRWLKHYSLGDLWVRGTLETLKA